MVPDSGEPRSSRAGSPRVRSSGVESTRPGPSRAHGAQRVLAVVLPELALELAESQLELERRMSAAAASGDGAHVSRAPALLPPVAVVLTPEGEAPRRLEVDGGDAVELERSLHVVNETAATLGLYRGQTLGGALAALRGLVVVAVPVPALAESLAQLADLLRRHGGLVSYEAPDTLWLELTVADRGSGEAALAEEVLRSFAALGHRASVAVAGGPWLARSFASFGELDRTGVRVVSAAATEEALLALPVIALPLPAGARFELARRGALTIADLRAMRSGALVEGLLRRDVPRARRGRQQGRALSEPFPPRRRSPRELLELLRGRDRSVLEPLPAAPLRELVRWESATESAAALDVALATLCSRLGGRLLGRQEAAEELTLLAFAKASEAPRRMTLRPRVPLLSGDELLGHARSRLRELVAGDVIDALGLEVVKASPARKPQALLAFAEPEAVADDGAAVTALLSALEQRLGADALGFAPAAGRRGGAKPGRDRRELPSLSNPGGNPWSHGIPTRWLDPPLSLAGSVGKDQIVVVESQAYVIRARQFEGRCTATGGARDYFRLWLAALDEAPSDDVTAGMARRGIEVLVYRDRRGLHLQAFFD